MCDKPDFDRAQNAATHLLLKQNIDSLFIDIRNFRFDKKILIDSVQHFAETVNQPLSNFMCDKFSGCCVLPNQRCNVVLFDNSEKNEYRKHWGIAHEIGHLYLEHEKDGEKEEKEAHFFAAQIVMPEIVMYNLSDRCGGLTPEKICGLFNASYDSACKRVGTFQRRSCFSSSKEDKTLLEKFRPILDREYPNEKTKQFWDTICSA